MDDLLKPSQVRKDRKPLPSYLPREVGGRFRVLSLLGSGACGDVVEAFDLTTRGVVALKMLRADRVSERVVKRFFREATAMGRVKHPGVVRVLDSGTGQTGIHYIAMELIRGRSLREMMRDSGGRLSAWEVARIAVEVCEVLQVAHSLGVIHRDLKPGNLIVPTGWLAGEDTLKVVDFGVAKVYEDPEGEPMTNLTNHGDSLGTPHYMSPEQISGKSFDGRADLYGLGCVMYHAISGYRPIDGPNQFAVLMGHLERKPVSLESLVGPDYCPHYMSEFIERMLAKDPDMRPINAAAAEAEVRQFIDLLPRKAAPMVSPPPSAEALETFQSIGKPIGPNMPRKSAPIAPGEPAPPMPTDLPPPPRQERPTPPQIPRAQHREPPPQPGPDPHALPTGQQALHTPDSVQSASLKHLGPMPTSSAMRAATDPSEGGGGGMGTIAKIVLSLGIVVFLLGVVTAGGVFVYYTHPEWIGLAAAPTDKDPVVETVEVDEGETNKADKDNKADKNNKAGDSPDSEGSSKPVAGAEVEVEISSEPKGAVVYRNARIVGRTPVVVKLDPAMKGPAVYLIVRAARRAEVVTVEPKDLSEGPLQINRELEKLDHGKSTIEIHSDPPGATVMLGKRFVGITPASIEEPVKKQTLKLRVEGEGKARDILVPLRREPQIVTIKLDSDADPRVEVLDKK